MNTTNTLVPMKEPATLSQADRALNAFLLNAICAEHRATNEEVALWGADYSAIWVRIWNAKPKPFRTKVKETGEGDKEDSVLLTYVANNHRYSIKFVKQPAQESIAA